MARATALVLSLLWGAIESEHRPTGHSLLNAVSLPDGPRILSQAPLKVFPWRAQAVRSLVFIRYRCHSLHKGNVPSGEFASSTEVLNGESLSLTVTQSDQTTTLVIDEPTPEAVAEALNEAVPSIDGHLQVIDETGRVSLRVEGQAGVANSFSLSGTPCMERCFRGSERGVRGHGEARRAAAIA